MKFRQSTLWSLGLLAVLSVAGCSDSAGTSGRDAFNDIHTDSDTSEGCDATDPCGAHGTCSDAGGTIACGCDQGWSGELCDACAAGFYQVNDTCQLLERCIASACSAHGTCDDSGDAVSCACDMGYTNDYCEACEVGYHRVDTNCVLNEDCALNSPCGLHSTCDDSSGVIMCTCDDGWAGTYCTSCSAGFHLAAGACVFDGSCMANSCDDHGVCSIVSDVVTCECNPEYVGTFCNACAAGYHQEGASCVIDEACAAGDPCGGSGTCDDTDGTITCACDPGWAGVFCANCAAGYHDDNGMCVLDESCIPSSCSGSGTCSVVAGGVSCACSSGYSGVYCASCAVGFHREAGACVADEDCAVADPCGAHGTCGDTGGIILCGCAAGWDGALCDTCAAGFHDDGGVCVLDDVCQPNSCDGHGTCSIVSSVVSCACDQGYAGAYCNSCDTGYHMDGGACVLNGNCATADPCGHGTCYELNGEALCDCNVGWSGQSCDACAAGFQDNDANDSCLPTCALAALPCAHGLCDDSDGSANCTCNAGWEDAICSTCSEDSYENNDYDSQAYLLDSSLTATGLAVCGTDRDWFAIYLAETDVIDVTITFAHGAGRDLDLFLWYGFDSSPSFTQLRTWSDSTTSNESVSYTVPSGEAGKFLIEVRGAGAFVQNTYDLQVTRTGPGCNTCAYLGNACGLWDDGCGGTIDCDASCPGLGSTHVCEYYQVGTCAQTYDDLMYGCCEGSVLHTSVFGSPLDLDCAALGRECGWSNDTNQPPRTGYFRCNNVGTSTTAPPGVFATCPASMTW